MPKWLTMCKPCKAAYHRARRLLGLQKYDNNKAAKGRRLDAKEQAIAALGGKCNRCGWTPEGPHQFPVMHFHHPERDRSWANIGFGTRSAEAIVKELERCELLCCRCHVMEHCEDVKVRPGRPRKPIDEATQRWIDKLEKGA